MKDEVRVFGIAVSWVVLVVVIVFILGGAGLAYKMIFAPRHAAVDRQVFEESQSYVQGKIQDLSKYHNEYQKTDDIAAKEAIKQLIIQQFAQFDSNKVVDVNLRKFLISMRGY
ncbi:MAG: hypothetical protein PHY72_01005 [Candidatus Pacebacteria bacterium]|nr:hypothetical protein [Candidatus Paceibacterota bacterium]